MAKKLYLTFDEDSGAYEHTVTIPSPKDNLTKADIDAAVKVLTDNKIFNINGHEIDSLKSAKYKENVVNDIE